MSHPSQQSCRAFATIRFPKVADYLEPILASIATHDMTVAPDGRGHVVTSAFGQAILTVLPGELHVCAEARDSVALNRMKHALTGPISFIAAREQPEIHWTGDAGGLTPLADLGVLRVVGVRQLTPNMRRIEFHGKDLDRFDRADQMHCRLIFAPKGAASPVWPMLGDDGRVAWPGGKMPTRVYTLRAIDAARGVLTIDFALHDNAGPATRWALGAKAGDQVGIVGPAAGGPKPASFYVLAGDETGLPGIARILESLPDDARGHAFVEVRDKGEELPLAKPAGVELHWLHRQGAAAGAAQLLQDAIRAVAWPAALDDVFVWGGCEHKSFRAIHRFLKDDLGLARSRQVLYSHWHHKLSEEQIIDIGGEAYLPE